MNVNDVVSVSITIEDQSVQQQNFGDLLILGNNKVFNARYKKYQSLDEMATDGFSTTAPEYLKAEAVFSQNPAPQYIYVGRRTVDQVTLTVATVANSTLYTTTINGTHVSFTSSSSATAINIATGLVAAITAASLGVTATANGDGTYTIIASVLGTPYTLAADARQTISQPYVASDPIEDDLDAVDTVFSNWYALDTVSRVDSDVQAAAAWIQAKYKIYVSASNNTAILDSASTTDIAYILKTLNYDRTAIIYHPTTTLYPESAWLATRLTTDPGAAVWAFATLIGVTSYPLTSAQVQAARDKNCNFYQSVGGQDKMFDGKMASGRYIDIRRDTDWVRARMAEDVLQAFYENLKIAYTDPGIQIVGNKMRGVIVEGKGNGVFSPDVDPNTAVTLPKAADVSTNDKSTRSLKCSFQAKLANAIQSVVISGTVTL